MRKTALLVVLGIVALSPAVSAETAEKSKAIARRVFEEIFNQANSRWPTRSTQRTSSTTAPRGTSD